MSSRFVYEPLPADRDGEGFPTVGPISGDLVADVVEAAEQESPRLEVEIVTNVDPTALQDVPPQVEPDATDLVGAAAAAIEAMGPAPHGTMGQPTIPRARTEPAIDPTLPAPDPIPADTEGWPEGVWTPGDAAGTGASRPMFSKDELRDLLRTPMHEYAVDEARIKCPTCRHCWQGYAVAPVRSQTRVLFVNFRRCLALPRFIVDLSGTRIVECSQYIPGGAPPAKPPEMLARERALGLDT